MMMGQHGTPERRGEHKGPRWPSKARTLWVICSLILVTARALESDVADAERARGGDEGGGGGTSPAAGTGPAPRIVLLWPEEGHTFRNGTGVIAALVTTNFDTPRQGSIELLLNGATAASFSPEAVDGEGNRRLHVLLPVMPDGTFSVEVRCVGVDGALVAKDGATFLVNSTAPAKTSSASTLEQSRLCHAVGFCDSDSECNGHGTCQDGACLCRGDWAGETCEHDIYHNPSFLPDSNPGRSPSLCHRSAVWEKAAKQVHTDLLALHALEHCVEEENIMWVAAPHHGLGGNMHILSVALTHAYAHKKSLGIVGEWTYGAHRGCRLASGLACYFEHHTPQASQHIVGLFCPYSSSLLILVCWLACYFEHHTPQASSQKSAHSRSLLPL